jgi:hypothetical protein
VCLAEPLTAKGRSWGPGTLDVVWRTDVLRLVLLDPRAAVAGLGAEDRSGESAELAGQVAAVASDLVHRQFRFLGFDGPAWVQLLGGLVVGLIALYSSYDHINFGQARVQLEQQWGIWCIVASLAVVAFDAQLATRSRRREEDRRSEDARTAAEARDRAAEARERAARREAAQLQRSRVEAEASRAQLAYSVDPSTAQRAQLEQALIKLSSAEVKALYDDEVLERLVGLR